LPSERLPPAFPLLFFGDERRFSYVPRTGRRRFNVKTGATGKIGRETRKNRRILSYFTPKFADVETFYWARPDFSTIFLFSAVSRPARFAEVGRDEGKKTLIFKKSRRDA